MIKISLDSLRFHLKDNMTEKKMTSQKNNPLHGITLKVQLEELVAKYGWKGLDAQFHFNCFYSKPTINSSLKFLRKTPWAREKVEKYYFWTFYKRDGARK